MKKVLIRIAACLALMTVFMPTALLVTYAATQDNPGAWKGIVVKCDGGITDKEKGGCDFAAFIRQINAVITYAVLISFPITAIAMAYAGYLLMTAEGNSKQYDAAKEMVTRVLIGFIIILGSWLLIKFILQQLVVPDALVDLLGDGK